MNNVGVNSATSIETWEDLEKELFTPEEIEESNRRVALIEEKIKAQEDSEQSQKRAEVSMNEEADRFPANSVARNAIQG